jgi:hypothetical protein
MKKLILAVRSCSRPWCSPRPRAPNRFGSRTPSDNKNVGRGSRPARMPVKKESGNGSLRALGLLPGPGPADAGGDCQAIQFPNDHGHTRADQHVFGDRYPRRQDNP